MFARNHAAIVILTLFALALCLTALSAQQQAPEEPSPALDETPAPMTVTPAPPARPEMVPKIEAALAPDTEIFRRTPVMDGSIDDGEWDTFYSHKTPDWEVVTYADWDTTSIYVGAKSSQPFDLVVAVDADDDGLFRSEQNYQIRAVRGADGMPVLSVTRYQSRGTAAPAFEPVTSVEASYVEMKSGATAGTYTVEMRIPGKLMRGFRLVDGRRLGLQAAVKTASEDAGWIPVNGPGETASCKLVAKKFAKLQPLDIGLDLRDYKIARGDELLAKFHVTNTGTENVDVANCVMGGEGRAAGYLSSAKLRMDGLPPKKHVAHELRSVVPNDMPLGCWALGAEARSSDGTRLSGALASFEVREPWEIQLSLPQTPVRVDVRDVGLAVIIQNNTRRNINGTAKITLPAGWEIWRTRDSYDFIVRKQSPGTVSFRAKPPLGALGAIPVKFDVTIEGKTKSAEGTFELINP